MPAPVIGYHACEHAISNPLRLRTAGITTNWKRVISNGLGNRTSTRSGHGFAEESKDRSTCDRKTMTSPLIPRESFERLNLLAQHRLYPLLISN